MNQNLTSPTIIDRLEAESAARNLIARYAHALDAGKFDEVGKLLQHAEFDVVGKAVQGGEAIASFLKSGVQRHADGTPRTWHSVTNVLFSFESSGEVISSESYYTVHQQLDGFALQPIVAGKYLDRFERHEGEWRFARREVTAQLFGNLQHHVKGPNTDVSEPAV